MRGWWREPEPEPEPPGTVAPTNQPGAPPSPERLIEHFKAAHEIFRAQRYAEAVEAYAAVEAESRFDRVTNVRVLAARGRAVALMQLDRHAEAAALLDELVRDKEALAKIVRDSPSTRVVEQIHFIRVCCHEKLGRWPMVQRSVADLINEVGTGRTPHEREDVAEAFMSLAQAATAQRRYDAAARALDAALRQAATAPDNEKMLALRREAQQRQRALPKIRRAGA
jgi:tetratricopeptide (TPR) repeat protein